MTECSHPSGPLGVRTAMFGLAQILQGLPVVIASHGLLSLLMEAVDFFGEHDLFEEVTDAIAETVQKRHGVSRGVRRKERKEMAPSCGARIVQWESSASGLTAVLEAIDDVESQDSTQNVWHKWRQ